MTDEIPTSTISPELRIKELEEALKQETERVLKVYDAFSAQEQEITTLKAEIEVLEKEIVDRELSLIHISEPTRLLSISFAGVW